MATFNKLPSGRWRVQLSAKLGRKSNSFNTKSEARAWAAAQEITTKKEGPALVGQYQLKDLFARYRDEVSLGKKGERWETIRLNKFCTYPLAELRLALVQREDVETWIKQRLQSVQSSSVNRELNLMSNCFTYARRWRWMTQNPMTELLRPKDPPPRDRRISRREIEQVLIALSYSEDAPVITKKQVTAVAFLFAIETAMRAGEICSLTTESVDLDKRVAALVNTKNGHGRKVPLTREAVRLLRRLPAVEAGALLFHTPKSGVFSTYFKDAVKLTTIKSLTFHDTRHEATTRLAAKFQVLDLARVTGHRDIKQLQIYYNKSAEDMVADLD